MGVFDEDIITAQELIAEFGAQVTWTDVNGDVHTPTICILPPGGSAVWLSNVTDTAVPKGSAYALMGAVDFEPTQGDIIETALAQYAVGPVDRLAPNGQIVLYTIRLTE